MYNINTHARARTEYIAKKENKYKKFPRQGLLNGVWSNQIINPLTCLFCLFFILNIFGANQNSACSTSKQRRKHPEINTKKQNKYQVPQAIHDNRVSKNRMPTRELDIPTFCLKRPFIIMYFEDTHCLNLDSKVWTLYESFTKNESMDEDKGSMYLKEKLLN